MKNIYNILEKNPVVVAPMAGFTNLHFRETMRNNGAYLAFSEMVSAKALCFSDKKTFELLKTSPTDTPLSVQIFGHEPDVMVKGAQIVENLGFDMIDINCGCPAPKVYKNGDGSSLMLNPHLIYKIVHEIRKNTSVTLSVKLRIGYDWDNANVVKCALLAEAGGADFVTVHGRTRDMQYSGKCDRSYIKAVKDALSIPVIGNGDVTDYKSYELMRQETGCDGVMVGRATLGNPFIIKEILNPGFKGNIKDGLLEMYNQVERTVNSGDGDVRGARALMLYYMNHFKMSREEKILCAKASTLTDIKNLIDLYL